MWPNKGDADLRPDQNSTYQRIPAIAPKKPYVPNGAIGALKVT